MKRILSLLICAMLIISSMGVVGFANEQHWSYEYISTMISDGIISGDSNGNLNLDNKITRAEFAKTINKYFGYTVKADKGFNDVSSDKWYYEDMLIAKGTGYMIGDEAGNANADSSITRAEAFVIIARLLGLEDDNTVSFTDASDIPSWAKGKIGALVKAGIVSGYSDGSIKANGSITRAEAFVIVSKNERTAMPDDAEVPGMGNTSSMVNVNVPSPSGASRPSGGGGGAGGGASVAPSSTVDFRAFNEKTFDVEYTATNFTKVSAVLAFADKEYTVDLVPTASSGNQYKASLKDAIVNIVNERNSNGDSFKLSLKTTAKPGFKAATVSLNKTFVADILPALTGFEGGMNLSTGKYEYSWDAIAGITDYAVNVYTDDTLTTKVAELSKVTTETSIAFDLNDKPLGTAYYVTVAVKNGNFEGAVAEPMATMAAGISGGDGSKENPYVISSATQFVNIFSKSNTAAATLFDKHFILISDIDISASSYEAATIPFKGSLSGWDIAENKAAKKEINVGNVTGEGYAYEYTSGKTYVSGGAIFNTTEGATVSHLILKGTYTTATAYMVGGLVGMASKSSKISYIDNNIAITSTGNGSNTGIAGIVGMTYLTTTVSDCSNTGDISGRCAAGIVGYNFGSGCSINNSYNTGKISATLHGGGIVGTLNADVTNCYNTGDVTTTASTTATAGGIGGYCALDGVLVENCWNSGKISSDSANAKSGVGGIVGGTYYDTSKARGVNMVNCYNIGAVSGTYVGAAVGNAYGSVNSIKGFYDATNKDMALVSTSVSPLKAQTITAAYIVGERNTTLADGTKTIKPWDIATLKDDVDYFKSNEAWAKSEDANYPYIQLAKVPYAGAKVVMPEKPAYEFTSPVSYKYDHAKTAYTVSWNLDSKVASYNVYVGTEKVGEGITAESYDIPASKIPTNTEEITVSAVVDSVEYFADPFVPYYGGGSGTEEDPYLVYTIGHLNNVNLNLGATYKQMVDIEDALTTPIGTHEKPFTGKYYGADETNKSVKLNISGVELAAMFSATQGATIEYITTKGSVAGEKARYVIFKLADGTTERPAHATAGLVAIAKDSPATNINYCINEATVTLDAKVTNPSGISLYVGIGGIVGYPMTANVKGCKNYGLIDAMASSNVGGIAGYAGSGSYTYNVNYGTITNGTSLGGVVGALYATTFEYNTNIGSINNAGNSHTGGVVGSISGSSSVKYCYNSGNVTGATNVGGIAGRVYSVSGGKATIANSFNTGVITGTSKASIVADYARGGELTISNVYDTANPGLAVWNTNTINSTIIVNNTYILNGTNLTNGGSAITADGLKALLTTDSTYASDVWEVKTEGNYLYPVLKALPYEKVVTIEATTLTVNTDDGKFILNWNLQDGVTYDVYLGNIKVATDITTNTFDATEYIEGVFQGDVYVVGNKGEASPSISNKVAVTGLFAGGTGTEADPYLIATAKHFENITIFPSAYFKQTKDIEGVTEPIANFTGVYDGDGHTIKVNLSTSDLASDAGFGLISKTTTCTIKNLTIDGSIKSTSSTSKQHIAAFVGYATTGVTLTNCVNKATIEAKKSGSSSEVAGFLGRCYKNTVNITNCVNYGAISCQTGYASGIVAMAGNGGKGTISNCANFGDITGSFASGIGGLMYCGITESYNFGKITGLLAETSRAAGIVGASGANLVIKDCFNAGEISNGQYLAAIAHSTHATSTVTLENCYSSKSDISLLVKVGKAEVTVKNSYNIYASDTFVGNGVTAVTSGTLKTTEISDAFTLLSENASNSAYNKGYVYPQIKTNLVPKDFEVPGAPETLEIKDIYFDENTADWMVKIDPTKNTEIATYTLEVGNDIVIEFEKSDLNADNAIALEKIAIGETTVSLTAYNSSNAPVLEAEDYTVDMTISGGEGTEADPYIISHAEQFVHFFGADNTAADMAKHYILVKDINLSDLEYVPSDKTYFSGSLKGYDLVNSKNIKREINIGDVERAAASVEIKAGATKSVGAGIINTANNVKISHLKLTGKLTSNAVDAVGGLVGYDDIMASNYSDIENHIDITATAINKGGAGGILGFARTGLTDCANYGDITSSYYIGGLIGFSNSATTIQTIENCVNYATITGNNHAGGLIGSSYHNFVGCANFGAVTGKGHTGGIAGYHSQKNAVCTDSFNAGSVTYNHTAATNGCGAIVGSFYFSASNGTPSRPFKEMTNCYNIGKVNAGAACGGSAVGNICSTGADSYAGISIKGYYDLANNGLGVYGVKPVKSGDPDGVANVTDAFIVGDADSANTLTLDSMKALTSKTGTAFANADAWKVDETASYKYLTLVNNQFDNNLEAFSAVE